jgi:gamma-glutamyltranspeptidase / glutathione hydrolase
VEVYRDPLPAKPVMRGQPTSLRLADPFAVSGTSVVTAAVPAAARVGLDVLRAGGNAFDAALAACFMETVWLPMKCGLAGDVVALVLERGKALNCLVSVGAGVAALGHGATLEPTGPCSVGVPGAPAGYEELARRASFSLHDLVVPAVRQAERGVHWSPYAVQLTHEAEAVLRRYNGAMAYLPDGQLPAAGKPLQLPGLAELLRAFSSAGAAVFRDRIGQQLVDKVTPLGGFLQMSDLQQDPAEWVLPEALSLGDKGTLFATPLPSHGPMLLRAVELANHPGADMIAAFSEARSEFARQSGSGTSVVCAADRDGNAVVVVHSNSFPQFGSGLVIEELDLVLNNRPGRGFSLDAPDDHWNAPQPGRRPFTTLHAWALEQDGERWLGATPGGVNQVAWNLQSVCDLLGGERDLGSLVTRPRWALDGNVGIVAEAGHAMSSDDRTRRVPDLTLRSAQQVVAIGRAGEPKRAAADPRTGAMAMACD